MVRPSESVLFYDGACGLCSRAVRFVLRWEDKKRKTLQFSPLQGNTAKMVLDDSLRQPPYATLVLWDGRTHWVEAAACRQVAQSLIAPIRIPLSCLLIPFLDPLTNRLYRLLSRNRNRLKLKRCSFPDGPITGRLQP